MSGDDAGWRKLLADVNRRCLALRSDADTKRSSSIIGGTQLSLEREQSTGNSSTLFDSNFSPPRRLTSSVSSWLEKRRFLINDAQTRSYDSQTSVSPERSRRYFAELPQFHKSGELHASGSCLQERRKSHKDTDDWSYRLQSLARSDVSWYVDKKSHIAADDGRRMTWLTGSNYRGGLYGDGRDVGGLPDLPTSGNGNHGDDKKDYSVWRTDSLLPCRLTPTLAGI